jgi:23S rRNA (uridine2552-2'-O)-methyltransferase
MPKVKNKKLKESSKRWVERQINDQYVLKAKKLGYRSRAAFKIIEINKKFKVIRKDDVVIDLGAAPGGWSQVASKICKKVIAIDLLAMSTIPRVNFFLGNFSDQGSIESVQGLLGSTKANVIMSDMSPNVCGIQKVDHIRIMNLAEAVFDFAEMFLANDGVMIIKMFQGGSEGSFLAKVKRKFCKVQHFKPKSSRKESTELYLIAMNYLQTNQE